MSGSAPMTARSSISQYGESDLLLVLVETVQGRSSSPFRRPKRGCSQGGRKPTMRRVPGMVHPLMVSRAGSCARQRRRASARWRWPPYIDVLQRGVFIERRFSRISPAYPRSLARCFSRARRHSAFCFTLTGALRVWVSKEKISGATNARLWPSKRARFFLRSLRRKTRLRPWERGTSRRFAQECPEGNPGKYKQGETPWHATKTKSR
jgi:hypothetical protein